ncbi:CDP-glucose 4,6-dehydratase [Gottfriedia solisilvae]|uniref:CDP-glucose 4,6-dehydratase n=1 Tax=Gottfriedia solisilvae TaxID=1516104 RepID=A0A8J3AV14_9BACI|nr:CDP-glucose 4,6-dehydratase [Gottfriedia solisilvae]GGI16668.1 CDP-glucose 4,6-dehydratase [Gottfriedia solisilvae]
MLDFYKGKKVFVTGHTGFKGTWLCKMLINAGAEVTGYSLKPPTDPNLFSLSGIESQMNSIIGDVRNLQLLKQTFLEAEPEIAIHLAAQPIVRDSYSDPHLTYETNVMGTVNFLECIRESTTVKSVLNVTTDKVYQNNEWDWGYREIDVLNGYDPYSNSKSCSEIITQCYKNSFFLNTDVSISTARAGNVIGGGDFANDRIIPDCIRAATNKEYIILRNPLSIRPYQHVLEPLNAYLLICEKQFQNKNYEDYYNVGPNENDCVTTERLTELFCEIWGEGLFWVNQSDSGVHEANFLKLDCSKIKNTFRWEPRWNIEKAIEKTIEWTRAYLSKGNIALTMEEQIEEFMTHNKRNYIKIKNR